MNDAMRGMIEKRRPADRADGDRALREVLQATALAGLWWRNFFNEAAFYGDTALRLFYGLDRFSEHLDFSLLTADPAWKLSERLAGLKEEIEGFGFSVELEQKHEGKIDSAFIKANTKIQFIRVSAPADVSGGTAANLVIKVKLEIDTDPPAGIKSEMKTLLEPFPVSVRVVTPPCLFAGKLHACLCRAWKSRVKGRDWYDFLFFISRGIAPDFAHLEARMRESGHWKGEKALTQGELQRLLEERIAAVDWRQAAEDVLPFVRDPRSLELWGAELFREAASRILSGGGE